MPTSGFSHFRPGFRRKATDEPGTSVSMNARLGTDEKNDSISRAEAAAPETDGAAEAQAKVPAEDAQRGVQDVEAVTLTWSKRSLVAVFILCALLLPTSPSPRTDISLNLSSSKSCPLVTIQLTSPLSPLQGCGSSTSSTHSSLRSSTTSSPSPRAPSKRTRSSPSSTSSPTP